MDLKNIYKNKREQKIENELNTELFILENLESVHVQRVEWQRNEHRKTILHDTICPVYDCRVCVCDLLYTRVNGVFVKPLSHVLGNGGSNWLENVWNVNLTRGSNYCFQKECLESLFNEDISILQHSDKFILVLKQYIYAKIKSIGI